MTKKTHTHTHKQGEPKQTKELFTTLWTTWKRNEWKSHKYHGANVISP